MVKLIRQPSVGRTGWERTMWRLGRNMRRRRRRKRGEGVSTKRRSGREDIAETSGDWIKVGEGEEGKKGRR